MIQSGYTDNMQPYFDELAARFMEANPDIDVSVQVVSWNDIDRRHQDAGRSPASRPTS